MKNDNNETQSALRIILSQIWRTPSLTPPRKRRGIRI